MDKLKNKLNELLLWIANNSESESAFLTPRPNHYVHTIALVDEIVELFELDEDKAIELINNRDGKL